MSLFERADFDAFVTGLAGVTLVDQWESRVAKVGDKVFAVLNDDGAKIAFKVSEESFEILTALGGVGQAAYFAKRKWVAVAPVAPLSDDELRHYLRRSYDLVAAGLTKKLRTELGIPV
ncbi:MmcQ/YjbR family DNA-binding protein [Ciceribacter ferrooxidans]|uniref:MmcQ/YjbR family DNA-binding protein n=1 Tax=Ciceribacter ferrooxidans TaxID=2509717 RepID=A0A4Q2SWE6_9HYPH|nr:MmcQ/YjbR family DNA-binding protein [Ciceribacter ferrooxidans]RYC09903.1 MmcQ/YjbR family DNA-binding protein [Ciceribacter ferrooxidans]